MEKKKRQVVLGDRKQFPRAYILFIPTIYLHESKLNIKRILNRDLFPWEEKQKKKLISNAYHHIELLCTIT